MTDLAAPPADTPAAARDRLAETGGGVVQVFGTDEETARRLAVSRLCAPDDGIVGILIRPDMRRRSWLASDILAGVGVRHDVKGVGRDEDIDWQLAGIWLAAHPVRHLVVARSEWLPVELLRELLLLAAGAGTAVWLLTTPPRSDAHAAACASWTALQVGWPDFLAAFADIPELLAGATHQFPAERTSDNANTAEDDGADGLVAAAWLPDDDFPSFRAACRARLSPVAWTWADRTFLAELSAATSWLSQHPTPLSAPLVADRLHSVYDRCATVSELLVATRATQVALFRAGWLCQVDLPRLANLAAAVPRRAQRTPTLWRRARVYRQPHRGTIAALAGAGLDLTEMSALTVADTASDGSAVLVSGVRRMLEEGTAVFVRAQLLLRAAHGAGPDAPLLARPDGSLLPERTFADILSAMRVETGLAVTGRPVARKRLDGKHWFTRWGVNVSPLWGVER